MNKCHIYRALLPILLFFFAACSETSFNGSSDETIVPESSTDLGNGSSISHEMIELGSRLDNPYAKTNVIKAFSSIYPTKSSDVIETTHIYARFRPENSAQVDSLRELGAIIEDFPLDYEIVRDGDYYQDPEIPYDQITWQYMVVPWNFNFGNLQYELIDECCISATSATKAEGIDWEAVERESFRLTGNERMLDECASTKAGGTSVPSGRIAISDEEFNHGKPFGVSGVKVQCNVFVKFASAFTDRDGYYSMSKSFSANPHYRIIFENEKGFGIGFNFILVRGSISTLGRNSPEGVSITIDKNSDNILWKRAIVNNAVYDYYDRCSEFDMNITPPPADLRIWILHSLKNSSATMLHNGAMSFGFLEELIGADWMFVVRFLLPDLTIGGAGHDTYASLYGITCHEMAHASHFSAVGTGYWDEYIKYILRCLIRNPQLVYGDGSLANSGYCEVGEMWAYFMQSKMRQDRYGGSAQLFGKDEWFKPQIFHYLWERSLSYSDIFAALTQDVTNVNLLKTKLMDLYPERARYIETIFSRYDK